MTINTYRELVNTTLFEMGVYSDTSQPPDASLSLYYEVLPAQGSHIKYELLSARVCEDVSEVLRERMAVHISAFGDLLHHVIMGCYQQLSIDGMALWLNAAPRFVCRMEVLFDEEGRPERHSSMYHAFTTDDLEKMAKGLAIPADKQLQFVLAYHKSRRDSLGCQSALNFQSVCIWVAIWLLLNSPDTLRTLPEMETEATA